MIDKERQRINAERARDALEVEIAKLKEQVLMLQEAAALVTGTWQDNSPQAHRIAVSALKTISEMVTDENKT